MAKWGVPHGFATLEEALASGKFEIASVCGPTGTHLETLSRLLDARIPAVFVEKPLDGAPKAALAMGQQFSGAGIPVAVNFLRRYDRAMQKLRSEIEAARHGRLRSITAWYSGGVMTNGTHQIDIACYLVGCEPELQSVTRTGGSDHDPAASVLLRFGAIPFHLIASGDGRGSRHELEIAFDGAVIAVEDSGLSMRSRAYTENRDFPGETVLERGTWRQTGLGSAMLNALDDLASWSRGARLTSDIDSACVAISIADRIRQRSLESSV